MSQITNNIWHTLNSDTRKKHLEHCCNELAQCFAYWCAPPCHWYIGRIPTVCLWLAEPEFKWTKGDHVYLKVGKTEHPAQVISKPYLVLDSNMNKVILNG